MNDYKVLIIDDHPIIRQGFASLIQEQPDLILCGEGETSGECIQLVQQHNPDVVIVDLFLKEGSGFELIKQIRAFQSNAKILVCSVYSEEQFGERVILAGANGFVDKSEAVDKLLDAIYAVMDGKLYVDTDLAQKILQNPSNEPVQDTLLRDLSNREFEIFQMIGSGSETKHIANTLQLSVKTIETHRFNIKKKLGLKSGIELNRYAMEWHIQKQREV